MNVFNQIATIKKQNNNNKEIQHNKNKVTQNI